MSYLKHNWSVLVDGQQVSSVKAENYENVRIGNFCPNFSRGSVIWASIILENYKMPFWSTAFKWIISVTFTPCHVPQHTSCSTCYSFRSYYSIFIIHCTYTAVQLFQFIASFEGKTFFPESHYSITVACTDQQ